MQFYFSVFAVFCICFSTEIICNTVSAEETTQYALSGTVRETGAQPVRGAVVTVSPQIPSTVTDSLGRFRIKDIPEGTYMLVVSAAHLGFEDVSTAITVSSERNDRIELIMRERTYGIDEIVVFSKREDGAEYIEPLPSYVTVIDRSEFENTAATVADVITSTPSASINVMGGLGDYTEVSLRGSYSNQVQVYIDGMLLNEAIGGAVNLGTIPLSNVETIEVWRSGAPASFGGNAVGGVINIRTRNITTQQKRLSLGYGSFNTFSTNMIANIPLGLSRFHITADYSSSNNNFRYKSDNGTVYNDYDDYWAHRTNDEYRSANLLGKYSCMLGTDAFLEVSEHVLSNRKEIPAADNIRYSHASLETIKNLFQARLTINSLFWDFLEVRPALHHIYTHERYRDPLGNVGTGKQDNVYDTSSIAALSPLIFRIGNAATLTFTPSAGYESFTPEFRLQETLLYTCDRNRLGFSGSALYRTPSERLTLTVNLDRERYGSSYTGKPSPYNKSSGESQVNYLTNFQSGIKVNALKNIYIRANYGNIKRAPSLYELFGDRGGTLSNPDLVPERIIKRDIGCIVVFGNSLPLFSGSIELAYFKNMYRDLIQWYATDAGLIHPDNVSGAYVQGSELIWNTRLLDHLVCSGNWTFQDSKVTSEKRKFYRGKKLPNRPENFGNLKLEYPLRNWSVFWLMNHKSRYYLDRTNQDHLLYPGRTLHDIGISASFDKFGTSCTLRIKNVTDVLTYDIQNMPKPGRSYMIEFDHVFR